MKTKTIIALSMALIAISYGLARYNYGLFVPDLREALGLSTTAVGIIASAGHAGNVVAIVLCMRLIRRFSPRALILLGGLCATIGLLLAALAPSGIVVAVAIFLASMSAGWIWTATPDAVRQLQPPDQQDRVLSWANGGTGVGVLAVAPVVLLLTGWREAYAVCALIALLVTLWAWVVLPSLDAVPDKRRQLFDWHWLVDPHAGPLLMMAATIGLISAIHWTFAVDLIVASGLSAPWVKTTFWFVSGVAGIPGVIVAGAIRRYGIRHVIPVNMLVLALALALLAVAPSNLVLAMFSAVCFGLGFIMITGLLAIWSVQVFQERPATGLGAVLVLITVGQIVGPAIAGIVAEFVGLIPVFVAGVLISLASMTLRPHAPDIQPNVDGVS